MKARRLYLVTVLCLAALFGFCLPAAPVAAAHPFVDLNGSSYESEVGALWELGVVSGLEADKYVPGGPVTRAQMAALIIRAMGRSQEADALKATATGFSDVPAGHWAAGVVALANRSGIIKGDAGRFFPNDPVNFAQAATMVVRALGYESQVTGGYPTGYVLKANELGLLKGLNFELYGGVNRGEAATLLYNAIFRAPTADTRLTWSQSVFRQAKTLTFGTLPAYVAPGQQVTLSASGTDLVGNPISGATVTYQVVSGSAQIQGDRLTIGDGGNVVVRAKLGNLEASTTLTVVSNLAVSPDTFQASKGGTVQLAATALSGGQRVSVQPQWKVQQGPATVSDTGLVTVSDYGNVVVQAMLGSMTATVTGQAVGKVTIGAHPAYMIPGLNYDFSATVTDSAGKALSVPVTWSAVSATINSTTGHLVNPTGQQVTVRATASGITDEVTVPVLKSIEITPTNSSVLINKTVAFKARGVDGAGSQYDISPRWERTNTAVGIIDTDGTFVGTAAGSTDITASVGSLVGRTQLAVSGQAVKLGVSADHATVPAGVGGSAVLTIKLLDAAGNVSPVSDQPISLTLSDTTKGSLSKALVLTQQGVATTTFNASSSAGITTVSVSAPGTTFASQNIAISSYVPSASYIQLTATPQPLATGGGVASITATLRDNNGFLAPAPQSVYVTVSASTMMFGGLTGTTITIPSGQSSGSLSFISNGAAGTVQISGASTYPVRGVTLQTAAAGPIAGVKIRPVTSVTPVTGLSTLQVLVDVLDAAGVQRANDNSSQVELTVSIPPSGQGAPALPTATYMATASGGVAIFQVPAYTVGTATLAARLVGASNTASDTTTAEFVPGVYSSLKLTAQPASVVADGFSQVQISADVVDPAGNVLSAVNPIVTFRKLTDSGSTMALTSMTVQAVNGRATLTVQTTRAAGTDTWYATAPGMETQNLATVNARASSGDAYTLRVVGSTTYTVGASNTLVVQVVDQLGQLVTTDAGRAITAVSYQNGVTVSPSQVLSQNGLATFTVTGTQAGSGAISFTGAGLTVPSTTATTVFTTSGSSGSTSTAYSLYASASTAAPRVGTPVTVWVRVMDVQGNVLTENGRLIYASVSGNASLAASQVTISGGVATFSVTGQAAGTVTITFTNVGLPQPTTSLTLTFTN